MFISSSHVISVKLLQLILVCKEYNNVGFVFITMAYNFRSGYFDDSLQYYFIAVIHYVITLLHK